MTALANSTKKSSFRRSRRLKLRVYSLTVSLLALSLVDFGCLSSTTPATYYGTVKVPQTQAFRWSDGGLPQTFDPAFAAAAPDTDVVRALFEGLTEYDPKTLEPVPAVARRWESTSDKKQWTFYLRDDARWSNGEKVTAADFVRSWERTIKIGPLAPHTELLDNIEGARAQSPAATKPATAGPPSAPEPNVRFGVEALADNILRVHLQQPDSNFPALVAHPVFRPVKVSSPDLTGRLQPGNLISNGAFKLASTENDRVLLEAATTYWDGASVTLQRVEFVNPGGAEDALAAYRDGSVDALTSAPFEPLALKILSPYKDFRRSTFGALTYYSFNTMQPPFDDVRVREALSISIDRERVSRDDLGGATEPADKFLPEEISGTRPVVGNSELLQHDIDKARSLLAEAGYPNGEGFPVVRLLINRNDQQRVVAQAIAAMWRTALSIQTEIVIKNWEEYEATIKSGGYDVVRRGMVMQTTDELTNLRLLFESDSQAQAPAPQPTAIERAKANGPHEAAPTAAKRTDTIESESQALKELKSVPIYFASSYALVKPYVSGFEANVLDAPSLKNTKIDTSWGEGRR